MSRRTPRTRRNRIPGRRFSPTVEILETRRLLCMLVHPHEPPVELRPDLLGVEAPAGPDGGQAFINWTNRGQTGDRFAAVFGANANRARGVVDAVLADYMQMIESFNYGDGSTNFNVTISMGTTNSLGASANLTSTLGGKPKSGTVTMGPGNNGSGGGWYLDPLPQDHTEFTGTLQHAYAGDAQASSPAFNVSDFYTVVAAEIAHCLGLFGGSSQVPGWNNRTTNTNITDNSEGGGLGTFWTFTGPSIRHLLTSNNAGPNGNVFGGGIHTAGPGADIDFGGFNWVGADDAGNVSYEFGRRYLVPDVLGLMFKDAYGYSVAPVGTRDSFYSVLNRDTGELLIRGGFRAGSSDDISVTVSGSNINVSVDVGDDVPGTGALPGEGNLPAYTSSYFQLDVTSIRIQGRDGNDDILLDAVPQNIPVTIEAGAGDDTIRIGDSSNSLNGIDSSVTIDCGTGTDRVLFDDSLNDLVDDTYTINITGSNHTFARGGMPTATMIGVEQIEALGSSGFETYNINRLQAVTDVTIRGGSGNDTINLSPTFNDLDTVAGDVFVFGELGTDTINLFDTAAGNSSFTLGNGGVNHVLDRTTFGSVSWGATTEQINLNSGTGTNSYTVLELNSASTLTINAGGGNDSLTLGAAAQSLSLIAGDVVFNADAGTDSITVNDQSNSSVTTYEFTHDTLTRPGFGPLDFTVAESLTLNGGSGANTYNFNPSGVSLATDVTINAGNANDTFNVTPTSQNMQFVINADLTFNGGGGSDAAFLFDGNSTVSFPYSLSSSSLVRGASPVNYSSLETIQLSGASGANTIGVSSLGATTAVTLGGGAGNDTFVLGGSGQNLDAIAGSVTLDGGAGTDSLELRDQQNVRNDAYTINATSFDRPGFGSLAWTTVESLALQGGTGGNLFELLAAAVPVTLHGNAGTDHFAIGGTSLAVVNTNFISNVVVEGGDGADTVTIFDNNGAGTHTYTVQSTTFDKTSFSLLTYGTVESFVVQANPSSNTFNIESMAAGTSLIAIGNGGNETFNLALPSGSLANLPSPITLNGGAGTDQILLFDGNSGGGSNYTLTNNVVSRTGFGPMTYGGSNANESVFVSAGAGNDTFNINSLNIPATVAGGNGNDEFVVGGGNVSGNVNALVRMLGGGGTDRMTVNDATTAANNSYTFDNAGFSMTGAPDLSPDSIEGITVDGSAGNNSFTILEVSPATPLILNGNGGDDEFVLSGLDDTVDLIDAAVAIDGGAGTDAISVKDSGNATTAGFTVTPTTFTRAGMSTATYGAVEDLTISSGGGSTKAHAINGTANGTPVRFSPGPARDVFQITETSAGGVVTVGASTGSDSLDINLDNLGQAHVRFVSSMTLGGLRMGSGGNLTVDAGGTRVLRTFGFSTAGGTLDLNDNPMIVDYSGTSPLDSIRAALASGYDNGTWTGEGINSSTAASTANHALGYAEASALFSTFPATFAGQSVDSTTIVIDYTRYGDANLDGTVNLIDFNRLVGGFGTGSLWSQGNFNYDGLTNLADFNLLTANFGQGAAPELPPELDHLVNPALRDQATPGQRTAA